MRSEEYVLNVHCGPAHLLIMVRTIVVREMTRQIRERREGGREGGREIIHFFNKNNLLILWSIARYNDGEMIYVCFTKTQIITNKLSTSDWI